MTTKGWIAIVFVSTFYGQSFTGFSTGNIVVSRAVYTGGSTTLVAGQPLPPVCPATASCGKAVASDNGAYPSLSGSNNVWNNDTLDGSFGITAPIFLDQLTPNGVLVNSLAIPTTLVNTSFSSKSEMALNLSTDGTAITFMAYVAPPNTIDVSNSNTPLVYDPTNPAGGTYFRAVVQVGANGALQVTPTNAYSGNNGRAAILSGGLYYMAGNGNNGSGTPANVVASEGVQLAIPGQSFATPPIEIGNFSISQDINPATGLPYPPDKAGKDNNFRGLTIFQNTLYVSKGSGSNGFNTVYRVGDKGSLPTVANAASAALTVLPGFSTTLARAKSGVTNPFGLFFANANTLYVADEGDGTTDNAASSKIAGLQKWVLNNGTWTMAYVLQNGLNLGQPYTVTNYPTSLNPSTDGLRNIAGKVNPDGTVTIWATTSTVSANGDNGADPNKLVSINDVLANTSAASAASEQFTTLRTAAAGEVLRGVSLTPSTPPTPAANVPLVLSATNPGATAIAPGSLATAAGQFPTSPTPTVSIIDGSGNTTAATFVAATPNLITFLVPSTVALGTAQVTITSGTNTQTASNIEIASVAPALFTSNGAGLASGQAIQVNASQVQTPLALSKQDANGATVPSAITLTANTNTYLILYGTGFAAAGTALTSATINGLAATVVYAGPAGAGSGLDQVNILIPAKAAGAGNANVQVIAEGISANPVQVTIQ